MDHSIEHLKFGVIETEALLRGKLITSRYTYTEPTNIDEVRRIDRALVRAFGSEHSRTIATPSCKIVLRGKTGGWDYVTGTLR